MENTNASDGKVTLLAAVRNHLLLPGETLAELREMWKKLTDQDKQDLIAGFAAIGIDATAQGPKSAS